MASASALKIVLSTPKNVRISASNLIAPRGLNLSLNPVGRASHSLRLSRSTLRSFHSSSSVRQSGVAAAAAAAVTLPEGLPAAVASAVSSGPAVAELQIPFSFGKKITIVFGSQTGTGKGFAHALNKDLKKKGFDARVLDLKDYDVNAMPSDGLMIFVVACFGHGEPTSNAQHFFEWMVSDRKEGWWPNVPYTIFGLGQSKQHPENYQAVARLLDKRLNDLGGKCFLERGEGDDSEDIESDFEAWTSKLMSQLKKMEQGPVFPVGVNVPAFNSPLMSSGPAATPTPAAAAATTQTVSVKENVAPAEAASPKPKASAVFFGEISKLMELHSPLSGRSVKHVEVSSHSPLNYEPGDWVGVVPENNARDVLGLAQRLGYKLHQDVDLLQHQLLLDAAVTFHSEPLGLTKDESTGQVSGNTTVPLELVLTRLVDLNSPPRRTMLRFLAQFASGDEKDKLEFLAASSPLAAQDYNSWVVAGRLTLLELLNWFPSIHNGSVPLDQLLEGITVLQPRFYSISCAPVQDPKTLSLTAAVVRYRSPHGFEHEGVTTSYLCRQKIGSRVPVFVKPSMFHLPSNPETPIVMVGAGTGLAPFRSFMQARVETRQIASCENPTISTRNLLFFGYNNRNHDFLYRSEWDKLQARCKGDFDIQPAFAFENPWRQFVQHKMIEPFNAKRIWNMLHNQKGNFYVCGDSRTVAPGALEALIHIAQTEGGLSRPDAELYFKNMQREKRYLLDVF